MPLAALSVALLLWQEPSPRLAPGVESGKYLIFQAGKRIGWESYRRELAVDREIWTGEVELEALGMKLRQRPRLVLDSRGRPVTLDIDYTVDGSAGAFHFEFGSSTYTVAHTGIGGAPTERHPLPADAVVLSNNVLHHNLLLVRRYDWKRGGRQEFTALPNTAVVLEARGEDEFRSAGRTIRLRRMFLTVAGAIGANLWLDAAGRLVRMELPLQRGEVVLEGHENLEAVVARVPPPPGTEAVEVDYPSGDHRMAGTLTLPAKRPARLPAVVLISGSGPQNRDEDSEGSGGVKLGFFRVLADALASRGIAVLRYDDRGVGRSTGNFPTANMTDLESDARAAIDYLRGRREIDPARIGIVGHSEGAVIGARIAATAPDVKALVMLAATARNGKALLRWQTAKALGSSRFNDALRTRAVANQEVFFELVAKADGDVADVQGQKISVRWFREFLAYEPLEAIRRVRCPVAILQGAQDIQAPPEDSSEIDRALTAGATDHELKLFPGLGHLFTQSSGEGIAELADSQKRVAPEVLEHVASFLDRKL